MRTDAANMLQTIVLGYLAKHCAGHESARATARIAAELAATSGQAVTARQVRDAVAALALAGHPVGTSCAGVFVCITSSDFRHAYRNLCIRLREQSRRCAAFKATARRILGGQGELPLESEDPAPDDELDERAAILEIDGGMRREDAEDAARAAAERVKAVRDGEPPTRQDAPGRTRTIGSGRTFARGRERRTPATAGGSNEAPGTLPGM